jgi:hypothetical protein
MERLSPMRMGPGHWIAKLVGVSLILGGLIPATASATITVGSDLSLTPTSSANTCTLSTAPCTQLTANVHAGNLHPALSPTNGTVVGWGIRTGATCGPVAGPCTPTDLVTFRLGKLIPGTNTAVGVATGPTVALKPPPAVKLQYPGQYFFPGPGPAIHVGDSVGIDTSATWAISANPGGCFNGAYYVTFHPVLTDGGSPQSFDANGACELLVNAVVEPSTTVKFGKLKGPFKGIYLLTVEVPGPGELSLRGKGVARQVAWSSVARMSKTVSEAGKAKLKIKPKGRVRRALASGHGAKVKVKVTFAPVGGVPGTTKHKLKLKS